MNKDAGLERLLRDALTPEELGETPECLDTEMLAAWAEGTLDGTDRVRAESHASRCDRCQAMLAAMIQTTPVEDVSSASARRWWMALSPVLAAAAAVALWFAVEPRSNVTKQEAVQVGQSASVDKLRDATPAPSLGGRLEKDSPSPELIAPERDSSKLEERKAAGKGPELQLDARRRVLPAPARPAAPPPVAEPGTPPASQKPGDAPPARLDDRTDVTVTGRSRLEARPLPAPAAAPPQANQAATQSQANQAATQSDAGVSRDAAAGVAAGYAQKAAGERPALSETAVVVGDGAPTFQSPDGSVRWRIQSGRIVQQSLDGGASWATQYVAGDAITLTTGIAPSSSVSWIVGRAGVVLMTDDGRRWRQVTFPAPVDLVKVLASDARNVSIVTADGLTFASDDGGTTWRRR